MIFREFFRLYEQSLVAKVVSESSQLTFWRYLRERDITGQSLPVFKSAEFVCLFNYNTIRTNERRPHYC